MKIVFVIKEMGAPGGGAERVVSLVAPALARRSHEVIVLTRDSPATTDFYAMAGVKRIRHGSATRGAAPGNRLAHMARRSKLADLTSWMSRLRRVLLAERPDVVIGVMHSSFLPVGMALIGTGVPVVASEHTVYDHYVGHGHYISHARERLALRLTPWLASRITVVSRSALDSFPRYLRQAMSILPNPVATEADNRIDSKVARELVVLSVGRLDAEKDHATIIDAFAAVAASRPEWRLEIAGDGPLRAALAQRIDKLGLSDRVTLLGPVSDVGALYRRASIFAMASRYESFGLAMAEAMAAGNAVIGFADCAGINELIDHDCNGILIDRGANRTAGLSQALAFLMENPRRLAQLGTEARLSVKRFDLEPTVDLWVKLLDDVVNNARELGQ